MCAIRSVGLLRRVALQRNLGNDEGFQQLCLYSRACTSLLLVVALTIAPMPPLPCMRSIPSHSTKAYLASLSGEHTFATNAFSPGWQKFHL